MSSTRIDILHLEDRAVDAELIERELKRARLDFSSTRVETEHAFREALERSDPDIILADYNLPGFDGILALKIAQELVPEIPFILVSGSIGEERAVQALREGAADYVAKDRPARLASAILRALSDRRQRLLRQRAQEALKRSEARYKHAANATQELILDWNLRSDQVIYNDAMKTVWGYQPETGEVPVDWIFEKIHPEEREEVEASKRAAFDQSDRWEGSYRFRAADGSYGHVLEHAVMVRDENGRPSQVICAMLDVSEQKITEELMRRSERRFRSVVQTARDAVIIFDAGGEIVFVNSVAQSYFASSGERLLGTPVFLLMPERNWASYREGIEEIVATGQGALLAPRLVYGLRSDGTEFPLDVSMSTWKVDGQTFFTSFLRDATERMGVEQRQKMELVVATVLFDAESRQEGIRRLLRAMGRALQWKVGLYWRVSDEGSLHCEGMWSEDDFDASRFFEVSRATPLALGEGVPGGVWKTGQPLIADADDPALARVRPFREVGLRSGFAFPITEAAGVTGVLEFYDIRPLQFDVESLVDAMGDLGRRIGEFLQRGRAEEKLKASEANLVEAQRIARLGSYSFDVATKMVEWSEETFQLFGLSPDQFTPTLSGYLGLVHPDDRSHVREAVYPPYADGPVEFHHRIVLSDGSIRSVCCRFRVMEGTAENPMRVLGTIQDVTERVESGETIERLGKQNRAILDSTAEAILGVGRNGKVIFANLAAVATTGFSAEELTAAPSIHEVLRHSDPTGAPVPRGECFLLQTLADSVTRNGVTYYRKKSGELFPVEFSASPMRLEGDQPGGVLSFVDITQRQSMERKLEQVNRVSSLGRVAATIAHEFNNVLMGIQPFAELIRRRTGADEKLQSAASHIMNSVARGKRVTQEILRFTQPSPPLLKAVEVGRWLDRILPELRGLVGSRVAIGIDVPEMAIECAFDSAQMHQVITNLVLNGRDAIADEGAIFIALDGHPEQRSWPFGRVPEGMVVMTVVDTGAGMSPEVLTNIFEPLFTTKRSGTGLGLAVVQQILASHHGSIHVSSVPGSGTTFFLVLPRAPQEVEPAPEAPPGRAPLVGEVLLVEDELVVAAGITALLESDGIRVRTVHLGAAVMKQLEEKVPDLVLLDVSLPDISGTKVYRTIAQRWPSLPVIFSTGHADEIALKEMLRAPNVGFLRKPYDHEALLQVIEQLLARVEVDP